MAAMVAMAFENIDQHRIATPWTPDQNHKQICKFVYMYFLTTSVLSFDVYLRIYFIVTKIVATSRSYCVDCRQKHHR